MKCPRLPSSWCFGTRTRCCAGEGVADGVECGEAVGVGRIEVAADAAPARECGRFLPCIPRDARHDRRAFAVRPAELLLHPVRGPSGRARSRRHASGVPHVRGRHPAVRAPAVVSRPAVIARYRPHVRCAMAHRPPSAVRGGPLLIQRLRRACRRDRVDRDPAVPAGRGRGLDRRGSARGCGSVLAAPPVITDLAGMQTRRFSSRVQDPELVAALLLQPGQQFAVDLAYPGGRGRFGRADLLDAQAGLVLVQVLPD